MSSFEYRRRHPRYHVNWRGSLRCTTSQLDHSYQVELIDISLGGACLYMGRAELGACNVAGAEADGKTLLSIASPGGTIESATEIRWYAMESTKGFFAVGVQFLEMTDDSKTVLQSALQDLQDQQHEERPHE